jgi:hypothetical protein
VETGLGKSDRLVKENKMNLLNVRWIRALLSSRWFPIVPQLIMLAAFGLLIAGGLGVKTSDPSFAKVLRNTNLANLLVWSYWWPLVIVAAALFLTALLSTLFIFRKAPAIRNLDSGAKVPLLLGVLVYWSIFGFMIFMWRFYF